MSSRSVQYSTNPLLASKTPIWRSQFIVACIALGFIGLVVRAAYVQVVGNAFFRKQGIVRFERQLDIPANRGRIFDRNGLLLASLSANDGVRLWDRVTWEQLAVLKCRAIDVHNRGLAFSPDGRLLAATSKGKVHLFDVGKRAEAAVLEGHGGTVTDLAFSPCGTLLARAAAMDVVVLFTRVPA